MSVEVTSADDVVRVELHRPDKLNAFDDGLVQGLSDAVTTAEADCARLIVFQGSSKGFSGGFDLSDLDSASDGDLVLRLIRIELLLQQVYHSSCATLALVHGPCYGAAADLVLACRTRIAAPGARFRMPGARFGIVLGTRRLSATVGADTARKLLLRDSPFDAEEALAAGFITQIAEQASWDDRIAETLAKVAVLAPETYAALTARMTDDTRNADLSALVRSAEAGSLTARLRAYLDDVARERTKRAGS